MTYVKAKRTVTVPMGDGVHKLVNAGDSVNLDDTPEYFQDAVGKEGSYTADLFEPGEEQHEEEVDPMTVDPRQSAENDSEAVTRERSEFTPEQRFGTASFSAPKMVNSPGRTLPESGADTPANNKYAEGTADTSESGFDLIEAGLELGDLPPVAEGAEDVPSETSDVHDGGDQPAAAKKPAAKPAAAKGDG